MTSTNRWNAYPRIYESNGRVVEGSMAQEGLPRSLGLPSGVQFGHNMVEIGNWRIAAVDEHHLTVAHKDSDLPSEIYTSEGRMINGGHSHICANKENETCKC